MVGGKYVFADRGKFEIEKTLGEGAFGSVYAVKYTDCTTPDKVQSRALKIIKCFTPENLQKSWEEVKILQGVDGHANIIKLLDAVVMHGFADFDVTKCIFILMELCTTNLSEILRRKPSNHYQHLKWMGQMSSAVQFLHSKRIVHRDLKPDNILLSGNLQGFDVKVADFGLAKNCYKDQECWKQGFLKSQVGSKAWMAPEVFLGKYTEKTDVFSMGAIWHGMLERQYEEDGQSKRLYGAFVYIPEYLQNCTDKLPLGWAMHLLERNVTIGMTSYGDSLSDSLKTVTRKLLAYDPVQRLSAQDVYVVMAQIENDVRSAQNTMVVQPVGL